MNKMDLFMHNIAFGASEMDITLLLAPKLHSPPFPADPINFNVRLFKKKKGCGLLTLTTETLANTFLLTYGYPGILCKGRLIRFKNSNRPVDKGLVQWLCYNQWE